MICSSSDVGEQTGQVASAKLALSCFPLIKDFPFVCLCLSGCFISVMFDGKIQSWDVNIQLVMVVTLVGWRHIDSHIPAGPKTGLKTAK